MQFEIYLLEIVNEVYFRFQYNYAELLASAKERLAKKIVAFNTGKYTFKWAEFGCRRRLSKEFEGYALKELKDKYQQNSDLPVFTYAEACFDDNGNMLLYLLVKGTEPFKKSNDSDEYRTCWYLIYIDDDYRDSGSPFAFIRKSGVTQEPFEDNWYIWWQDERTC
jgi:hypothetical protein